MRTRLATGALTLALAGCTIGGDRPPSATMTTVPVGERVTCIGINQILRSRVQDDSTIDFVMTDGTVMRNTLPHPCPGLGFEGAFRYSTPINRLCNVDIITVVNQGGGPRRGASCGLGMFQPIKPPEGRSAD